MASRATLKSYFLRKKKPTAAQFADLIDSLLHRDEDSWLVNIKPHDTGRQYYIGDVVLYGNSLYVAKVNNIGPWNNEQWNVAQASGNIYEAGEAINVGDPLKVASDGKVYPISVSSNRYNIPGEMSFVRIVMLTDSLGVIAYIDGISGNPSALAFTITEGIPGFGEPIAIRECDTSYITLTKSSGNSFLVAFQDAATSIGYAYAGQVEETSIALGDATVYGEEVTSDVESVTLSGNEVVITYGLSGTGISAKCITISGNEMTIHGEFEIQNSLVAKAISIASSSPSTLVVGYSTNYEYNAAFCEVADHVITVATVNKIFSKVMNQACCAYQEAYHFVGREASYGFMFQRTFDENEVVLPIIIDGLSRPHLAHIGTVSYLVYQSNYYLVVESSGSRSTLNKSTLTAAANSSNYHVTVYSDGVALYMGISSGAILFTKTFNGYVGIAANTAAAGDNISILTTGNIWPGHSDLTPNQLYGFDEAGALNSEYLPESPVFLALTPTILKLK